MINVIKRVVALSLASELAPVLARSHDARITAFIFGCVFLTLWFYSHFPGRYDAGLELRQRRLRDLRAGRD